jgi:hypothetical protein
MDVGDLSERVKIQLPEGSGELAASTNDHAEVSNEREAVVVEDSLITKRYLSIPFRRSYSLLDYFMIKFLPFALF